MKRLLELIIAAYLCTVLLSSCIGHKLSNKSWSDAFADLHLETAKNYPFSEWKKINLDSLHDVTARQIKEAEEQQSEEAFYLALRRYAFNFHDQHVFIAGDDFGLQEKNTAGSFGLGIIKLDNGKYIVHYLSEKGPAKQAGIEWGAEIIKWNGTDINEAVNNTSIIWADRPQATKEGEHLEKCRYLLRAPLGIQAEITYKNPGSNQGKAARLITFEDDHEDLENSCTSIINSPEVLKDRIKYKVLLEKIGYIKITKFMPSLVNYNLYGSFKSALESIIKENVHGIIIDVRGNQGGIDKLVPQMCSHFFKEDDFYEYVSFFDSEADSFKIDPDESLGIQPKKPYYGGQIVVIVDKSTISTGEGLPMVIQRLENGTVIGQYATAGSFAMGLAENIYKLPEGIAFGFLGGRSLDKNKNIQIDSNADGCGGVQPDIRVPLTYDYVYRQYYEKKDVILEEAVKYIKETQN